MKAAVVLLALVVIPSRASADDPAEALALYAAYDPSILVACHDSRFDAKTAAAYVTGCTDDNVRADCTLLDHPGVLADTLNACGFKALASWTVCHGDHPPAACDPKSEKMRDGSLGDAAMRTQNLAGGTFSVDPTTILVGATDFFVARAKQELVLFLRDRIADTVCPDGNEVAKRLLPSTCVALKPADGTSLEDTLSGLREAFQDDLERLPSTVLTEIAAMGKQQLDDKARAFVCFGTIAFETGTTYVKSGAWTAFKQLLDTDPAVCKGVTAWTETKDVRTVLEDLIGRIEHLIQTGASPDADDIAALLNAIAAEAPDPATISAAIRFVADQTPKLVRLVDLLRRLRGTERNDVEVGKQAVEAAFDLIGSLIEIPTVTIDDDTRRNIVALERAIAAALEHDYVTALIRLAAVPKLRIELEAKLPAKARAVLHGIERFGPTIAEIAKARTPEDVQTVLENAASPAGSWREYRRRKWPGFVSGVLGVAVGHEAVRDADNGNFAAAALPVGFETGTAIGGDFTLNFLFPLVDLGALTNIRLGDAESGDTGADGMPKTKTDLDFASVIAPGVFIELGISKSPFVIGAGLEYAPAARRYFECDMTAPCDQTTLAPAARFLVFLGIDMPVFPLW